MAGAGTLARPTAVSHQTHFFGFRQQVVPEFGMGQTDDGQGPLAGGFAHEVDHTVFRGQVMGIHPGGGDHGAGGKAGHHPGDFAALGGGLKGDEGFSAFGIEGPPHEIQLPAGAAEFEAA
jgi:hypothetical protein